MYFVEFSDIRLVRVFVKKIFGATSPSLLRHGRTEPFPEWFVVENVCTDRSMMSRATTLNTAIATVFSY